MAELTFDSNRAAQATLTVRLSTDTFVYTVHDPAGSPEVHTDTALPIAHTSLTANITKSVLTHPYTQGEYRQARFLLAQASGTAVPSEVFKEELAEVLYKSCFRREPHQSVWHTAIPDCGIVWLYAVDTTACQLLHESYPEALITASAVPLLRYLHTHSRQGDRRKLYAYVHESQMDVYAFDRGHFLLTNTFRGLQQEDLIYYLLYIWQQLGFDQQEDECLFIDDSRRYSAVVEVLKRYIRRADRLTAAQAPEGQPAARLRPELPFDLQTSLITEL